MNRYRLIRVEKYKTNSIALFRQGFRWQPRVRLLGPALLALPPGASMTHISHHLEKATAGAVNFLPLARKRMRADEAVLAMREDTSHY